MTSENTSLGPARGFYEAQYAAGEEIPRTNKLMALECLTRDSVLHVLDVGCGTGMNSERIAAMGHKVTGVDISRAAVDKYQARGFEGRQADLDDRLPFEDRSFDAVFCSEVIEHTVNPESAAAELFRVLRPGGTLVLTTPNSAFWAYRVYGVMGRTVSELQHPKHLHFFSERSLHDLLREAGFEIQRAFGRNMYIVVPTPKSPRLRNALGRLGLEQESRFTTGGSFLHRSSASSVRNSLFADTLIVVAARPD